MSQNCQHRKHRKIENYVSATHITKKLISPPQVNSYCNVINIIALLCNFSLLSAFCASFLSPLFKLRPISTLCFALPCLVLHYWIFFTLPLPFALLVLLHPFYVAKIHPTFVSSPGICILVYYYVTKLPTPQNTANSSNTHCNHQIINSLATSKKSTQWTLHLWKKVACYLYCHCISLHHFSNYNPLPTTHYKGVVQKIFQPIEQRTEYVSVVAIHSHSRVVVCFYYI